MKTIFIAAIAFGSVLFASPCFAQNNNPGALLNQTALEADTSFFKAYNECDIATLSSRVDDNLEFYHDQGGVTNGKAAFLESIQKYVCGKAERRLVSESFQVFEMKGIGFLTQGEHTFCNKIETPNCKDETNGIGKFFMLWTKTDRGYVLTRVFSFEHINSRDRLTKATPK